MAGAHAESRGDAVDGLMEADYERWAAGRVVDYEEEDFEEEEYGSEFDDEDAALIADDLAAAGLAAAAPFLAAAAVGLGLGRIVALHHRSSPSYRMH
jgi:hypothetical protein